MEQCAYSNLIDMLEQRASDAPEAIAYSFLYFDDNTKREVSLTFKGVYDKARAVAVTLRKEGLKSGDRVIIFSSQTHDNIYAVYGALLAGAIFTLIPPPIDENKKQRFKSVYESSKARFILCNELIAEKMEESIFPKNLPKFLARTLVKSFKGLSILNVEGCRANPDKWSRPAVTGDTLAYIQYSSGSTSAPKGVMISHGNVLHNIKSLNDFFGDDKPRTSVAWAPFFHNMGLVGMIFMNVHNSSRSVVLSPLAFLESPKRWFQAISDYKANMTMGPDSAYGFCASAIDDRDLQGLDLSHVKYATNGSEPINIGTVASFAKKFAMSGFRYEAFSPGYGLAEATCVVTAGGSGPIHKEVSLGELQRNRFVASNSDSDSRKSFVTSGSVVSGIKAIAVNPDTLEECAQDEIGEIWLQGPNIAKGYWGMEKESRETFMAEIKNHQGSFLRTGDLGVIHENNLYVTGRLKELIIVNGHNMYSHDIELNIKERLPILKPFPIVSFSISVDRKERVVTCIEVPATLALNYRELAQNIAGITSKVFEFSPYDIVFVPDNSLPRTDNRKIQANKTKAFYESGKLEAIFSSKNSKSTAANERTIIRPSSKLEEDVLNIFKKVLNTQSEISTDDNFFMLGGDSLTIPQIAGMINSELNIDYPIKRFLEDPTVEGVAKYIDLKRNNLEGSLTKNVKELLLAECRLDEAIRPGPYPYLASQSIQPSHVFVTGTTGFVGAHLVRDLMAKTEAKIYCHVRAKNDDDALDRISDNMKYYKCWDASYASRIVPVLGELSESRLGIDEGNYEFLADTIDTIYHNGALLNFIYPYSYLKGINVYGTAECLRLACTGKPKYFNHVSTFSVYDNPGYFETVAMEDDPLESPEGYFLGYSESKWVAEKLVMIARSRGLKAAIYRPGEITGASDTGIWKMTDLVSRFIISCIQMKAMPRLAQKVHMTPVDYVSGSIVALSLQHESYGRAFNIVNKNVKTLIELPEIINAFGYEVELLPYEEWKQRLAVADDGNVLKLLQPLFFEEKAERESIVRRYTDLEAEFDVTNTLNGINKAGITCPAVDDALVSKYLRNFIEREYLTSPSRASSRLQ